MYRGKVWRLLTAAVVVLGVAVAARATDPDDSAPPPANAPPPPAGSMSVFNQMFGLHGHPKPPPPGAKKPKLAEDAIPKARAQELANLLRRQAVCVRLMEVADTRNDEGLRKKAQELDRRAMAAYQKRMADLGSVDVDGGLDKRPDADRLPTDRSAELSPSPGAGAARPGSTIKEEGTE